VSSTDELTVSGLLPPQTITPGSLFIEVTLNNGEVYNYTIPTANPLTLEGGKHYQFRMKFSPGKTAEVTMSVADWVGVAGEYIL